MSLRNFYIRRALRIFPVFYCYWILITGLLVLLHGKIIWNQAICSFFYIVNYYQGLHGYPETSYSLTWSLAVEEQFYLLWPMAFLLFGKSPRRLASALTTLIGSVWVYRIVLVCWGVREEYIYTAFETRIDHLLIGCLLAVCFRGGLATQFFKLITRQSANLFVTVALIVSSCVIGCSGVVNNYRNSIGFIVDPVLVTILIVQLLALEAPWTTWLDWKPIAYLGTISYATYLFHGIAIRIARDGISFFNLSSWLHLPLSLMIVWTIASLSYVVVERPFLRLKNKFQSSTVC